MQLAISKNEFARALASTSKAIESKRNIPILSHVRLAVNENRLHITATDLDIVVSDSAECDASRNGELCVDAKLLSGIVSKAAGDISLAFDGDKLTVKSGRSKFSLAVLPAEDFPDFTTDSYSAEFELDIASFFAPCIHAISTEETRYYLNGVYFAGLSENTVAVSTDGHRLSKNTMAPVAEFAGIIVPRKTVGLLPKGVCRVSVSDAKIRIEQGSLTLVSKLIDGTYPDYERVIPKGNFVDFAVDRAEIMRAAERVVTVSSERGRAVRLSILPGAIGLSARSELGEAQDEVTADYSGEPVEVGFNSAYLRDLLAILPDGHVAFSIDPSGPGLVKHPAMDGWTGVLMPMRV